MSNSTKVFEAWILVYGVGGWGVGNSRTYRVRMQEASTALISRERKPPLSSTCKAWMVAPPGEQTLSLSWPGCCSESSSILAAPYEKKEGLMAVGHLTTCFYRVLSHPSPC